MPSSASPPAPLSDWFALPAVCSAMADEQAEMIPALTAQIGVRGLYLRPAVTAPRELSGNMLQAMTALHPAESGLDGDLRCAPGQLPFGSESFSLVYLLHVLEQRDRPMDLIRECARCLQPEGMLVAVVFNPISPFRLRWPGGRLRALGGAALERLLRDAGLSVERRVGVGRLLPRSAPPRPGQSGRLRALSMPFLSSQAVIARKRRVAPTLVGPSTARLRARATPS